MQAIRDDEDLPPYQDDLLATHGYDGVPPCEGQWGPYVVTMTPQGRVWTRTYTSPDGTVITEVSRIIQSIKDIRHCGHYRTVLIEERDLVGKLNTKYDLQMWIIILVILNSVCIMLQLLPVYLFFCLFLIYYFKKNYSNGYCVCNSTSPRRTVLLRRELRRES